MKLSEKYHLKALGICLAAFLAGTILLVIRYDRFVYSGWDLALYAQLMWSLCHGQTITSLFGVNFLADHASYIAFLLVPIYALFQNALTLLLIKFMAFLIGAYLLFLIAFKRVGGFWALLLMTGYIFYPPNITLFLFEFNFENLAIPLIFGAFYCLDKRCLSGFFITCLLLALVKENMPPVVFLIGVYAFLCHRKDMPELTWKAPLLALSGLLFFVISIALIHPKLTENLTFHASNYWQFYRNLGDTPLKILGSFILNPAAVAHKLFTMNNLIFLAGVFGPVGVIALLTPLVLLTALPLFLQHLLSAFPGQQSLDYYYASTLAVFVFIAAVHSFARIEQQQRNRLLILIMSALFIFDLIHLTPLSRFLPSRNRDARLRHELLSRIPKDAGVIASYSFLPFLSQRKDLFVAGRKIISFTRESQRIPDSVRFALVDFSDFTQDKMAIYRLIQDPQWSMDTLIDDVALLKKTVSSEEKTILIQKKPFIIQRTSLRRTPFLLLEAIDIPSVISRGTSDLPVIFYWKTLERIPGARTVTLRIFQEGKQVFFKMLPISNGLPFRKDRYIKNLYNYSIPPLNPGNYEIEISFNAIFPSEPVRRTLTVK